MKRMIRWCVATAIVGSFLLIGGNGRDPWLWAYVATFGLVGAYAIRSMDDDLAKERFSPPSKGADRLALRWVRLIAAAHIVVGILDSRFGWTSVPGPLRGVGLVGFGLAVSARCPLDASKPVLFGRCPHPGRSRPPCRRHRALLDRSASGYAGMIVFAPFSGLALGSWISVAVAFVYSALVLRRVTFEDRFLRKNLTGYEAYTARVPYRLVPRLW